MAKMKRSRPRKNLSDESESESDSDSDYHHSDSSTPHLEHKLSETQRSLTQSTSSLLAQWLRTSPRLNKYPILDVKDMASPSSTLTPPLKNSLSETTSASQTFNLVVAQEPQEIDVPFRESTTNKKRGRPRKVKEILVEEFGHSSLKTTASDKEPARCLTPEEHNLSETRRYPTRSTSPLLAQCVLTTTPRLKRYPIRNVKGIASPSSTLVSPPKTGLSEKASAPQSFNLVVSQEPQVRVTEAGFSSSKSRELPDISADCADFDKLSTKFFGTDQASTPLIPPTSAVNGNLSEGSCINGNEQSKCLGKCSSLNYTQIVGMLGDSDDEVDSIVDPALVTVKGYRVKEEMAPILRSIILKFGDIAKDCSLKSTKSRSFHLEMVCAIYLNLEKRRKPTDITGLEIKNLLTEVADLEATKVEVGWLRKRLEEISEALEECKRYKTRTDEKAQKSYKELMLVKDSEELKKKSRMLEIEAEESRKRTRLLEIEAEESRKKTQMLEIEGEESRRKTLMLEIEGEESRKKARLVETELSALKAEVKQSEEEIEKSREKLSLFKKPLVAGLLQLDVM